MPTAFDPSAVSHAQASDTQTWNCPRGRIVLVREAPNVVRIVMLDHVDGAAGRNLARALDQVLKSISPLHSFWDLEALGTYDSVVRTEPTRVLVANWSQVGSMGALAHSKIVRMGVTVANIALRNRIRLFSERAPFETYLRELVEKS